MELTRKIVGFVDRELALSRASLMRELPGMIAECVAFAGREGP